MYLYTININHIIEKLQTVNYEPNGMINIYKTDNKIATKYQYSPIYLGTKLWNELPEETQFVVDSSAVGLRLMEN